MFIRNIIIGGRFHRNLLPLFVVWVSFRVLSAGQVASPFAGRRLLSLLFSPVASQSNLLRFTISLTIQSFQQPYNRFSRSCSLDSVGWETGRDRSRPLMGVERCHSQLQHSGTLQFRALFSIRYPFGETSRFR